MFYQVPAIILSEDGRMERVALQSNTLASVVYHAAKRRLEIEFRTGTRYLYFQVPSERYQQLLNAESKGAYFNHHIRNHFPYQRLSDASTPVVLPANPKTK
jgi:KTSC domain